MQIASQTLSEHRTWIKAFPLFILAVSANNAVLAPGTQFLIAEGAFRGAWVGTLRLQSWQCTAPRALSGWFYSWPQWISVFLSISQSVSAGGVSQTWQPHIWTHWNSSARHTAGQSACACSAGVVFLFIVVVSPTDIECLQLEMI